MGNEIIAQKKTYFAHRRSKVQSPVLFPGRAEDYLYWEPAVASQWNTAELAGHYIDHYDIDQNAGKGIRKKKRLKTS